MMLSIQRRGVGVLVTWAFIAVAAVYVLYVGGVWMFAVDGGYTEWSEFSECSVTCGGGAKTRTRLCTNPIPNALGQNCSRIGPSVETQECESQPCPVDGQFGEWGAFSECSTTCGDGTKQRERKCDNPIPQYGGKECVGDAVESQPCTKGPCPVNGVYSQWSLWSECSVSCGTGEKTRSRECNNPAPQHGGTTCEEQGLGAAKETAACEDRPCVVTSSTAVASSSTAATTA